MGRGPGARVWAIAAVAPRLLDRRFRASTITSCLGKEPYRASARFSITGCRFSKGSGHVMARRRRRCWCSSIPVRRRRGRGLAAPPRERQCCAFLARDDRGRPQAPGRLLLALAERQSRRSRRRRRCPDCSQATGRAGCSASARRGRGPHRPECATCSSSNSRIWDLDRDDHIRVGALVREVDARARPASPSRW